MFTWLRAKVQKWKAQPNQLPRRWRMSRVCMLNFCVCILIEGINNMAIFYIYLILLFSRHTPAPFATNLPRPKRFHEFPNKFQYVMNVFASFTFHRFEMTNPTCRRHVGCSKVSKTLSMRPKCVLEDPTASTLFA